MQQPPTTASPAGWRPRLCFLGYRHLNALAEQVLPEYTSRATIEVLDASFDSAALAARERERAAAVDVFVTAGSNAAIVRETATLPVATIQLDGYDLLLALLQARRHGNRVGVVSYRDTIASLDEVKELLNIDIAQCAYLYPDEARACFDHFAGDGRSVIVGSSIAVELARQRGLHGILAYSAGAVRRGIEDAIAMAHVARRESTRHEQVHAVLHNLQEAVLATDAAQRIVAANSAMQRVLGARLEGLRGRPLAEVDPVLAQAVGTDPGSPSRSQVLHLAGREWVAHHTPLRDGERGTGSVIALHDAQSIEEAGSRLRAQRRQRRPAGSRYRFSDLLGQDPLFQHCVDSARRFAHTDLTVLITGESGTGKELFAQAIHDASTRAGKPFVALNCSALPETLLESELFGHEEGAFTGSRRGGKPGLFEAAHQGTLFLDEIGDMPLVLQTRLLRVLQEREVTRLGGATPIPVDVRIVAATHQPLPEMITRRQFRADLYFRLNVLRIALPPLRSRPGDVLLLAGAALQRALARLGSPLRADELLQRVAQHLLGHGWPGNVRELENICERVAVFFSAYASAAVAPLEQLLLDCPELEDSTPAPPPDLQAVLAACGGNRNAAAARLGISRATLWRRLRATREADAGFSPPGRS